jgi:hypothetical protein
MFALIRDLAFNGQFADIEALTDNVWYQPNVLPKGNDEFFFGSFSPRMTQKNYQTQRNDDFVGPPTEEEWWNQYNTEGDGDWWTDFDWAGVIGALGGAVAIFSNWGEDTPDTAPGPRPQPGPGNGNDTDTDSPTMAAVKKYWPIGVLLLVLAYLAAKGKL